MNELEALVAIWQRSRDVHADLWMFYIVVLVGVVGYCLTDSYARVPAFARGCLVVLLLGFMAVNGWSIWDNLAVYNTATAQLKVLPEIGKPLKLATSSMREIHAVHLVVVHGVLDACVIAVAVVRGSRSA